MMNATAGKIAIALVLSALAHAAFAAGSEPDRDPQADPTPCLAAAAASDDDKIIAVCGPLLASEKTAKPDRIEAQQRLIEVAHRTGVRVVGPNCVGLANTRSGAGLNFMPGYAGMGHRRGPIGIVSQSGALGYTVLQAMQRGVGFSHYLAAGNSCDVDVCDFISYLAEDDDTRAIVW